MHSIIAYGLLLLGIPIFIGFWSGWLVAIPAQLLALPENRNEPVPGLNLFAGVISGFAAALLFGFLAVKDTLWPPILMAAWISVYLLKYRRSTQGCAAMVAGVFLGWFICLAIAWSAAGLE